MNCFDKFKNKMMLSGNSLRNENIKNSRELVEKTFFNDASLSYGIYFWYLGFNPEDCNKNEQITIRLYKRFFSNANGVSVKFQTLIDTPIIVGDIIYDSNSQEYFICTESFNIDNIHWQGKLTLCNWMLKWQNKNGDILEYPCNDMNTTQYNSGETSNRNFTIATSQHMLTLPCDENTVVLNSPQRFFLDKNKENPTSFKVSQNDTTSYAYGEKGLVKITVMECVSNSATDRIDLGICDYIDKNEIKNNNLNGNLISKSIISYNSNVIKSGGDYQVFTCKFFDDYENEITGIIPKWNIICDFTDSLDIKEIDDRLIIGIDDDSCVDEEFKIILSDSDDNYKSSLIVKIGSLL